MKYLNVDDSENLLLHYRAVYEFPSATLALVLLHDRWLGKQTATGID